MFVYGTKGRHEGRFVHYIDIFYSMLSVRHSLARNVLYRFWQMTGQLRQVARVQEPGSRRTQGLTRDRWERREKFDGRTLRVQPVVALTLRSPLLAPSLDSSS